MGFNFDIIESYPTSIIRLICLTGTLPYYLIEHAFSDERSTIKHTSKSNKKNVRRNLIDALKRLREDDIVQLVGKGQMKRIWLSNPNEKKARKILSETGKVWQSGEEIVEDYFYPYSEQYRFMIPNYKHKSYGANNVRRELRISDCIIMLYKANVEFMKRVEEEKELEKPELTYGWDREGKMSYPFTDHNKSYFYFSKEVKAADWEIGKTISLNYFVGFIVSNGGIYLMYSAYHGNLKMSQQGEQKSQHVCSELVMQTFKTEERINQKDVDAVIVVKDYEMLYKLIALNGKGKRSKNTTELVNFKNVFSSVHCFPMDKRGEKQFSFILNRNWKYIVNSLLFGKENLKNFYNFDAFYEEEMIYAIQFVDNDISKLTRIMFFAQDSAIKKDATFKIYHLPEQKEFLIKIIREIDIELVEIDEDSIVKLGLNI